jgi:2',3'-cyclic-nucleotide 2'-phosphodiesterase (5'-nucleotidase family)
MKTMKHPSLRILTRQLPRVLPLALVLLAGGAALGQPAAQPQKSPPPNTPADVRVRARESAIDASISDDPAVEKMLAEYAPKVRELDVVIGRLQGELRKFGVGAGSMGNFVTDAMLTESRQRLGRPVALAVVNGGGLRKSTIGEGELRHSDIFELLPFENALVSFEMTGEQVLSLLKQVLSHRDAQSGARVRYRVNADKKNELESARLIINGRPADIDPTATYTVISIDYLMKRTANRPSSSEGDYSVLSQAKKIEPLGLTIRDAVVHYVKSETAAGRNILVKLDGRFSQNRDASVNSQEPQP